VYGLRESTADCLLINQALKPANWAIHRRL
jgi:hypothetical protein